MEQKAKTPEGDSARWRPRRLAEEAPAAPLGKQSHLRKSTAELKQHLITFPLTSARLPLQSTRLLSFYIVDSLALVSFNIMYSEIQA
ncbi:hypothetical protein FZC74_10460 [Sutcliffiella horikoshii]|uniref:Uncharacterized protein n=1 Tax=Sutcliffiella horikoshii TaxID=79883 RepID=A0AA95B790_9BACI|nr:hypothetical protein FZC74_10460 [Sutcliffiella horikoshii]